MGALSLLRRSDRCPESGQSRRRFPRPCRWPRIRSRCRPSPSLQSVWCGVGEGRAGVRVIFGRPNDLLLSSAQRHASPKSTHTCSHKTTCQNTYSRIMALSVEERWCVGKEEGRKSDSAENGNIMRMLPSPVVVPSGLLYQQIHPIVHGPGQPPRDRTPKEGHESNRRISTDRIPPRSHFLNNNRDRRNW